MLYIVGLGNPGSEHEHDRHNVGFMVLDALVAAWHFSAPVMSAQYSGRVTSGMVEGEEATFLYPDTFMNNSGVAVRKLVPKGEEKRVVVIYDDVDIPLGELKISVGRGDGGHNGVKSLIEKLGTKEFVRVRIGIAPKTLFGTTKRPQGARLPKYVLGKFTKREEEKVASTAVSVADAVRTLARDGVAAAMNQFN